MSEKIIKNIIIKVKQTNDRLRKEFPELEKIANDIDDLMDKKEFPINLILSDLRRIANEYSSQGEMGQYNRFCSIIEEYRKWFNKVQKISMSGPFMDKE